MENLNKHIEHTLLKQDAGKGDLIKLFEEAKEHKFLGVCNGQPTVYILARGIAFLAEQINIHICQLLILQSK